VDRSLHEDDPRPPYEYDRHFRTEHALRMWRASARLIDGMTGEERSDYELALAVALPLLQHLKEDES
jgi:hypothetical protein